MSFSKADDASPDANAFLEAVVTNAFGVKVTFGTPGHEKTCPHCGANNNNRKSAWNFRQRCFYARAADRSRNTRIYDKDDPMYGKSHFDNMTLFLFDEADGTCSVVGVKNLEGLGQVAKITILSEPFKAPTP